MRLARSEVVTQIFEAQWGEFPITAGLRPLITVTARDVEEFGFAPAIQKFRGSSLKQRAGFRHQAAGAALAVRESPHLPQYPAAAGLGAESVLSP